MDTTKKLWVGLISLLVVGFSVLLWMGGEIHRQQPPMPEKVQTESGKLLFTRADIETGRTVWQSIGGQQLGSIWGHGALVAPDWSADWLHRETEAWLSKLAQQQFGMGDAQGKGHEQFGIEARGVAGEGGGCGAEGFRDRHSPSAARRLA